LTIVVEGEPDPETRRVVDLRELDRRIEDAVLLPYDHRNLNRDVPTLQGKVPTLEVLLEDVWDRVAAVLPSGELREVVLRIDEFLSGSLRR
jgi:6-pyruvoyltetrahydropterin/6-carboxytetrahydropterin synthase